ncbi:MAG: rolling circle replication-associated protein, partial [Minisyncoccia bacterium]
MIITLEEIRERQLRNIKKRIKLLEKEVKTKKYFVDFLTITFKDIQQFLLFKERKFKTFFRNLRKNYFVEHYFWVIEFQKRGVPHYHILVLKEYDKKIGFVDLKKA